MRLLLAKEPGKEDYLPSTVGGYFPLQPSMEERRISQTNISCSLQGLPRKPHQLAFQLR